MSISNRCRRRLHRLAMFACLIAISAPGFRDAAAGNLEPIRIELHRRSTVEGDTILLGEIARITGADPDLVARLRIATIGQAPLPGESRQLNPDDLQLPLKQAGIDTARVRVVAPEPAIVTRSAVVIEAEDIKAMVDGFLRQNFPRGGGEFTVKEIRVPDRVVLPGGRLRYDIVSARKGDLIGTFPVSINFYVNETVDRKIWTTVTVEALTDAVVTVRPLGRYRPITAEDIEVRKLNRADLPANAIGNPEDVIGQRTRFALQSNMVLRTDLVELPPLVKRGDMVTILARSEGLKITALGQVKQKGRLGERIAVVNFDSKKVIFARVLDANTVEVEY